ncbi:hypothetical protein [Planctomycetes bacterium Pan216]|uniref:hypothetical protein n=1 Tax=Kolteria novifilia TaxID=2527975 RepID=UPI0011A0E21B
MRKKPEDSIDGRVERALELNTSLQRDIPVAPFLGAATECENTYIDGYFYNCISVCQAAVEGLAKFLLEQNGFAQGKNFKANLGILQKNKVISKECKKAFEKIHKDRNDFHHVNKNVKRDPHELNARAIECLESLSTICLLLGICGSSLGCFGVQWANSSRNTAVFGFGGLLAIGPANCESCSSPLLRGDEISSPHRLAGE